MAGHTRGSSAFCYSQQNIPRLNSYPFESLICKSCVSEISMAGSRAKFGQLLKPLRAHILLQDGCSPSYNR